MFALMTHQDAVFDGLSFGIKYLVRSFDLKVEPGGRKGFVTPCREYYLLNIRICEDNHWSYM